MSLKKLVIIVIGLFLGITSIMAIYRIYTEVNVGNNSRAIKSSPDYKPEPIKQGEELIVYYFHRKDRCPSCITIEKLTGKALKDNFQPQLSSGLIKWVVLNVDEPENKHFNDDYKLYANAVVLSKQSENKELAWKNLEDVWDYMNNEEKFSGYIRQQVNQMLEGS